MSARELLHHRFAWEIAPCVPAPEETPASQAPEAAGAEQTNPAQVAGAPASQAAEAPAIQPGSPPAR